MQSEKKVILITNIPTPYRVPLFNIIGRMLSDRGIELKVVFCAKTYKKRNWDCRLNEAEFKYVILDSIKFYKIYSEEKNAFFFPIQLFGLLLKEKPDLIVDCSQIYSGLFVYPFSKIFKVPYIPWSGETSLRAESHSRLLKWLKYIYWKRIVLGAKCAIVYGTKAAEYLQLFDSEIPIFKAWNTVDLKFFDKNVEGLRKHRQKIYEDFGVSSNRTHILTTGYLFEQKGLNYLFMALGEVKKERENFLLHVVGDGPERKKLEELAQELALQENVRFYGFKQHNELPNFYAIADLFVFSSLYDIWGLVLNEAMSSGLPIIASKYAGATYDLIKDGINGFIVNPYDTKEMAEKILMLIDNPNFRKKMGEKSSEFICNNFSLEKSAQGFMNAINYSLKI